MGLLIEKILSIIVLGLGFLVMVLSSWLMLINKKKGIVGIILSILFLSISIYYVFLCNLPKPQIVTVTDIPIAPVMLQQEKSTISIAETTQKPVRDSTGSAPVALLLEVDSLELTVYPDNDIEINKNSAFKIKQIITNPPIKKVKANVVGFIGNPRMNDGQDVGYSITYNQMSKRWATGEGKNKYKIEIKKGEELLGTVHITFVEQE